MHTYPTVEQLRALTQAKARNAVAAAARLELALNSNGYLNAHIIEEAAAAAKAANTELGVKLRELRTSYTRALLNELSKLSGQSLFDVLFENAPDSPAGDDILVGGHNQLELAHVVTTIFTCLSRRIGVACPPVPAIPVQPRRPDLYRVKRSVHALLSEATVNKLANL